jgi:hypothetical protein
MSVPPRRRTWLWFYIVLGILSATGILVLWATRDLRGLEPLTLERLELARQLWQDNGPDEYRLDYRKRGSVSGTFLVEVRQAKAVSVLMDGQELPSAQIQNYTMPVLFDELEDLLKQSQKPEQSGTILNVRFHPKDGHIERYIFSFPVTQGRRTLEVTVQLRPIKD